MFGRKGKGGFDLAHPRVPAGRPTGGQFAKSGSRAGIHREAILRMAQHRARMASSLGVLFRAAKPAPTHVYTHETKK